MKDRGEKRHIGTILSSFLMGTGLGILFAPRSGRRTRKEIERLGRKTKRRVWDDDLIEDIAEVTRDNLEKGKEITEEKKKKILEMIESGEKLLSAQKENLKKLFR
jgi:gas vesicle protein